MAYPKQIITVHLFLTILCTITAQSIYAADEPTRIRKNSSLETIVEGYTPIGTTQTQSPLHIPSNTLHARQVIPLQPLGCCALISQGTQQLKTEWDNSYPYFRKCTWPPRVDRSNIHPDVVKCNETTIGCVGLTFCCPCITGYVICKSFEAILIEVANDTD